MSNFQHGPLLAAIGVAVGVIGAAGIFIFEQFRLSKDYKIRNRNLELMNKQINELQEELKALRQQQSQRKKTSSKRRAANANSNNSTIASNDINIDGDTFSTAGTDFGDDEFYDCSETEEITSDVEARESEPMNELEAELLEIDAQEEKFVEENFSKDTYYRLHHLTRLHSNDLGVIWRFLRACCNYIDHISDIEDKQKIINEGFQACQNVMDVQDGDLHKWYASLLGLYTETLPIAEKIKQAYNVEKHLRIAIRLKPEDSFLHYFFGRFKYALANLSWFERKMAATFFDEIPYYSYEDAIESFEQAEQLATKPHLANCLFLSKSYIGIRKYEKAVNLLNKMCVQPAITKDDENAQYAAKLLLKKYSSYLY